MTDSVRFPRRLAGYLPSSSPRLQGRRLTDLSAAAGGTLWAFLAVAETLDVVSLGLVELFVALAMLAFVPLGLGLVPRVARGSLEGGLLGLAILGQLPVAVLAVVGLALPVGSLESVVLVAPWLAVTGSAALVGLSRVIAGGLRPLPDLAVSAALLYLPVGATALLLHRADITFHFRPIIILLTVVHYHYAGFVLPLVAGLTGKRLGGTNGRFEADLAGRVAAASTVVIVVNLALIAVGITFSPAVEVVAVALFTVAVAGFAAVVIGRVVPTLPHPQGSLLALAATTLFVTMALALAYGYSAFPATDELVTIGEMVRWHGTLNAFGFALPGLLAFRLLDEGLG